LLTPSSSGWGRESEGQKQEKNLNGRDKDSSRSKLGGRKKHRRGEQQKTSDASAISQHHDTLSNSYLGRTPTHPPVVLLSMVLYSISLVS